jgi:hypothetical protein
LPCFLPCWARRHCSHRRSRCRHRRTRLWKCRQGVGCDRPGPGCCRRTSCGRGAEEVVADFESEGGYYSDAGTSHLRPASSRIRPACELNVRNQLHSPAFVDYCACPFGVSSTMRVPHCVRTRESRVCPDSVLNMRVLRLLPPSSPTVPVVFNAGNGCVLHYGANHKKPGWNSNDL